MIKVVDFVTTSPSLPRSGHDIVKTAPERSDTIRYVFGTISSCHTVRQGEHNDKRLIA